MAILAIVAFLIKLRGNDGKDQAGDGLGGNVGEVSPNGTSSGEVYGGPTTVTGHHGNSFPQVLPNCDLVENGANDGDTFRVRYGGKEQVFDLYLADSPEISLSYPELLDVQSRYYGGVPRETVVRIGEEARVYSLNLLRSCPFTVFTSWEKVPGTPRHYAFIVVEHAPGRRCFLSELLVLRGFAQPVDRMVTMPAGVSDFPTFRKTMTTYEQRARREKKGGWGIIAGKPVVRRAIMVPASG